MIVESAAATETRQLLIVCASEAVTATALTPAIVAGTELVLFRGHQGRVCAFLNRCPHRGKPLADGLAVDGHLICRYHGWVFNADGRCIRIPGLRVIGANCDALTVSVVERDGLVLVESPRAGKPDLTA